MRIISVISTKGGVGKTTLAANLGGLMADAGLRVLLIDLDAQPTLSSYYELAHRAPSGIYELLAFNEQDLAQLASHTVIDGLDIIISNDAHRQLGTLLLNAPDGRLRLRNLLPAFRDYDLLLIDTQGARSVLLEMAVLASEQAISPVTPEILTARELRRGTLQLLADIAPFRHLGISPPPLYLLMNRVPPVSANAIRDHLLPDKRTRSKPRCQLSVIRMNSTYLECVDKLFAEKGGAATAAILFIVVASVFLIAILVSTIQDWSTLRKPEQAIGFLLAMYAIGLPFIWFMWWGLRLEAFRLTHYPIRFNRKTRMVHWFRFDDGTVQSEPWEKLYFTLKKIDELSPIASWEVVAHRLSEDGKTVLETFGLPYTNTYDVRDSDPFIWSQWEFVRRYMEEPEELGALADQVEFVMDVVLRALRSLRCNCLTFSGGMIHRPRSRSNCSGVASRISQVRTPVSSNRRNPIRV
jgi:cellulose biosynthesis protein BcsQ